MRKQALIALLFGGIAVWAFAPFNLWVLIFISYSGLLWLISRASRMREAICLGFCWGLGYFAAGVHWIYISIQQFGELPVILALGLMLLLIAYLSLYIALFAGLTRLLGKPFSLLQLVITAPAIWQLTEFLRGYILTGFAWLQPGYSQLGAPLAGFLPLFGVYGVNLLLLMLCGLIVYLLHQALILRHLRQSIVSLVAIAACLLGGELLKTINWTTPDISRTTTIALLQGNIQQSLKWRADALQPTLQHYEQLTQKVLNSAKIIIWPEAAIPDIETNQQNYLHTLDWQARRLGANIAVGIVDYRRQNASQAAIYNTLLVLGDTEPYRYFANQNRYNKYHLVPFGEFIPLQALLAPIAKLLAIPMSSMSAGDYIQPPLNMQNFKFLSAICYEITLPQQVWDNFTTDTDFLLTVSNDAWFGRSIGPWQHLQMAQTRAAEFGRPLIRSTNTGITVVTDRHGRIIKQLPQFTSAILTTKIAASKGQTPYAKWGTKPYWITVWTLLLLAILICASKKRQNMA